MLAKAARTLGDNSRMEADSRLPTLVTAVFDFTCESGDLPNLLAGDCPMVVYTDEAHAAQVRKLRRKRPTRVQVLDPGELGRAELYEPLRRRGAGPDLATKFSKPLWLYQQAQENPFGSRYFYWMDARLGALPRELLDAASFARLLRLQSRFLLLCQPHEPERDLRGFDADALARLAGVERTRWVARGELFGGAAASVAEVGARYSQHLERTLGEGLVGNEEALLTLQSYVEAGDFDLQFIGADGNLRPFFDQLAASWPGEREGARRHLAELAETWILSFNAPLQLQRLLESLEATEPALLRTGRRVLVNNSTRASLFGEYDALCARYGLEQVREGNRGVNGARMRAAELFLRGGRHAMFWFEDDLLLAPESDPVQACENGLPRHVHGVAGTALGILQREFADYVKLSFTETSGAHHLQRAWSILPESVREHYFPGTFDVPPQAVSAIQTLAHVPYAVGEAAYSNWPHVITRRGTQKLFLEEHREPCYEQYWTARSFEMLRQGRLRAAVLLASPVEHKRTQEYPAVERVDYQRVEDKPLVAPPVEAPAPRARRDWPARPGAIFVSVANYRDSETTHTLRDLFASAKHPERVFAGVFSQVVPGEDDDCLADYRPHGAPEGHVRELRAHAADSLGACWARSRILEELLQGEEFVLQVDSHSRFEPGWDERLLERLGRCPSPRALLSAYPPSYDLPDTRHRSPPSGIAANVWDQMGILILKSRMFDEQDPPKAPVPGAFIAAGFLFGPAAAFREVPYDPHLYFHGEEISMSVRLWTHGWDLFAPGEVLLYHDYSADRGRARNWEDRRDWVQINMRSFGRVRHLLGIEPSRDPVVLREIERYGLGTARTLAEYEEFADIDFAKLSIGPRASDGRFPAPMPAGSRAMLRAARERYLDKLPFRVEDGKRVRETRSGPASTFAATAVLRKALGEWLRAQRIRSLVDAGCGDFNWMQAMDLAGVETYAGYDIVPELIARNQELHGGRRGVFFSVGDIARVPLPACDAILCRRVLCEMPEEEALRALANFRASGARYLLASTRVHQGQDARLLRDLLKAPFSLPKPQAWIPDCRGAALGVWPLAALEGV